MFSTHGLVFSLSLEIGDSMYPFLRFSSYAAFMIVFNDGASCVLVPNGPYHEPITTHTVVFENYIVPCRGRTGNFPPLTSENARAKNSGGKKRSLSLDVSGKSDGGSGGRDRNSGGGSGTRSRSKLGRPGRVKVPGE